MANPETAPTGTEQYDFEADIANVSPEYDFEADIANVFKPKSPEPGTSLSDRVKDVGITALKGVIGFPETLVGLADIPTGGRVGKTLEESGVDFKRAKDILSENYSPAQKQAFENVQSTEGFVPTLKAITENPSVAGHTILESVPNMLGGQGIAKGIMKFAPKLSPLAAGAIGEGGVTAGQNIEQVRQQTENGLLTPEQIAVLTGSGAVTGAVTGGFGKAANALGVGDVSTAFIGGQKVIAPTTKNFARRGLESGGLEAAQEAVQSGQEQAASNIALGKDIGEGVGSAAALGSVAGLGMGLPAGALIHAQPTSPNVSPEEQAITDQQRGLAPEPADFAPSSNIPRPNPATNVPTAEFTAPQEQGFQPPDAEEQALLSESQDFINRYKQAYGEAGRGQRVTKRLADAAARLEIPSKAGDSAQTILDAMEAHITSRIPPTIDEQVQKAKTAVAQNIIASMPENPGVTARSVIAGADTGVLQPIIDEGEAIRVNAELSQPPIAGIQELSEKDLTNLFRQKAATIEQKQAINSERERRAQLSESENAVQEPGASPPNDGSSAQSELRKKSGDTSISSEGLQSSRQGNGNIEQAPPEAPIPQQPEIVNDQSQNPTAQEKSPEEGQKIIETPIDDAIAREHPLHEANGYRPAEKPEDTKKAFVNFQDLPIAIENPAGSIREAKDGSWKTQMQDHYGEIKLGEGADGDAVDVFIPAGLSREQVDATDKAYVIDQVDPGNQTFDEHKVILGPTSEADARDVYQRNYDQELPQGAPKPNRIGAITEMPIVEFKAWLKTEDKTQPVSNNVSVKAAQIPANRNVEERRVDIAQRKKVSEMTPEELRKELLTHELTGIGNLRAYNESEKLPAQVYIDVMRC